MDFETQACFMGKHTAPHKRYGFSQGNALKNRHIGRETPRYTFSILKQVKVQHPHDSHRTAEPTEFARYMEVSRAFERCENGKYRCRKTGQYTVFALSTLTKASFTRKMGAFTVTIQYTVQ